jgi:hypothetical protein
MRDRSRCLSGEHILHRENTCNIERTHSIYKHQPRYLPAAPSLSPRDALTGGGSVCVCVCVCMCTSRGENVCVCVCVCVCTSRGENAEMGGNVAVLAEILKSHFFVHMHTTCIHTYMHTCDF